MSAKAKARLSDIEVKELSAVDNAANKKTFLMVKSADGVATPADAAPGDPGALPPAPAAADGATTPEQNPADAGAAQTPAPAGDVDKAAEAGEKDGVAKRGAKMAKERLTRFKASIEDLQKIVTELEGEVADMQDAGDAEKVAKSDEPNPLQPKLDELTEQVAALTKKCAEHTSTIAEQTTTITKQADIIKAAQVAPPPNSTSPEGIVKADKPFAWPSDLNAKRRSN